MAYIYICAACAEGRHEDCEGSRDRPPPGMIGGGVCACQHGRERSALEQELLERDYPEKD